MHLHIRVLSRDQTSMHKTGPTRSDTCGAEVRSGEQINVGSDRSEAGTGRRDETVIRGEGTDDDAMGMEIVCCVARTQAGR